MPNQGLHRLRIGARDTHTQNTRDTQTNKTKKINLYAAKLN